MPNNDELIRVINNTTDSDYDLISDFSRIDECCESVRLNGFGSIKDMPKPYTMNDKIYFGIKEAMIPFYMTKINGNKFSLFELSLKKYTELGY